MAGEPRPLAVRIERDAIEHQQADPDRAELYSLVESAVTSAGQVVEWAKRDYPHCSEFQALRLKLMHLRNRLRDGSRAGVYGQLIPISEALTACETRSKDHYKTYMGQVKTVLRKAQAWSHIP